MRQTKRGFYWEHAWDSLFLVLPDAEQAALARAIIAYSDSGIIHDVSDAARPCLAYMISRIKAQERAKESRHIAYARNALKRWEAEAEKQKAELEKMKKRQAQQ